MMEDVKIVHDSFVFAVFSIPAFLHGRKNMQILSYSVLFLTVLFGQSQYHLVDLLITKLNLICLVQSRLVNSASKNS